MAQPCGLAAGMHLPVAHGPCTSPWTREQVYASYFAFFLAGTLNFSIDSPFASTARTQSGFLPRPAQVLSPSR